MELTLQEEEPLKPSLTLVGTGFTQMFSDSLSPRFSTLLASFLGSNLSGYIVDTFFAGTGFSGLNAGLLISAGLRFVLGLGYLTIYETRD